MVFCFAGVIVTAKVVELILERGMRATLAGNPAEAVRAFGEVMGHAGATDRERGMAAFNRGLLRGRVGDWVGAIDDWGVVVLSAESPRWLLCRAYLARGNVRAMEGDDVGAVCDYSAVMRLAESLGTHQAAAVEAKLMVEQEWSPLELQGRAGARRGTARLDLGDIEGGMEDVVRVMGMAGISTSTLGEAHAYCSQAMVMTGRFDEAIAEVGRALALEPRMGAHRAVAGVGYLGKGDFQKGMEEFQAGVERIRSVKSLERLERLLLTVERRGYTLEAVGAARGVMEKARVALEKQEREGLATTVRRMNLGR